MPLRRRAGSSGERAPGTCPCCRVEETFQAATYKALLVIKFKGKDELFKDRPFGAIKNTIGGTHRGGQLYQQFGEHGLITNGDKRRKLRVGHVEVLLMPALDFLDRLLHRRVRPAIQDPELPEFGQATPDGVLLDFVDTTVGRSHCGRTGDDRLSEFPWPHPARFDTQGVSIAVDETDDPLDR